MDQSVDVHQPVDMAAPAAPEEQQEADLPPPIDLSVLIAPHTYRLGPNGLIENDFEVVSPQWLIGEGPGKYTAWHPAVNDTHVVHLAWQLGIAPYVRFNKEPKGRVGTTEFMIRGLPIFQYDGKVFFEMQMPAFEAEVGQVLRSLPQFTAIEYLGDAAQPQYEVSISSMRDIWQRAVEMGRQDLVDNEPQYADSPAPSASSRQLSPANDVEHMPIEHKKPTPRPVSWRNDPTIPAERNAIDEGLSVQDITQAQREGGMALEAADDMDDIQDAQAILQPAQGALQHVDIVPRPAQFILQPVQSALNQLGEQEYPIDEEKEDSNLHDDSIEYIEQYPVVYVEAEQDAVSFTLDVYNQYYHDEHYDPEPVIQQGDKDGEFQDARPSPYAFLEGHFEYRKFAPAPAPSPRLALVPRLPPDPFSAPILSSGPTVQPSRVTSIRVATLSPEPENEAAVSITQNCRRRKKPLAEKDADVLDSDDEFGSVAVPIADADDDDFKPTNKRSYNRSSKRAPGTKKRKAGPGKKMGRPRKRQNTADGPSAGPILPPSHEAPMASFVNPMAHNPFGMSLPRPDVSLGLLPPAEAFSLPPRSSATNQPQPQRQMNAGSQTLGGFLLGADSPIIPQVRYPRPGATVPDSKVDAALVQGPSRTPKDVAEDLGIKLPSPGEIYEALRRPADPLTGKGKSGRSSDKARWEWLQGRLLWEAQQPRSDWEAHALERTDEWIAKMINKKTEARDEGMIALLSLFPGHDLIPLQASTSPKKNARRSKAAKPIAPASPGAAKSQSICQSSTNQEPAQSSATDNSSQPSMSLFSHHAMTLATPNTGLLTKEPIPEEAVELPEQNSLTTTPASKGSVDHGQNDAQMVATPSPAAPPQSSPLSSSWFTRQTRSAQKKKAPNSSDAAADPNEEIEEDKSPAVDDADNDMEMPHIDLRDDSGSSFEEEDEWNGDSDGSEDMVWTDELDRDDQELVRAPDADSEQSCAA